MALDTSTQQTLNDIANAFTAGQTLFNNIFYPPNTGQAGTVNNAVPNASGTAANNPPSGGSLLNQLLGTPTVNTTVGIDPTTKTFLIGGGLLIGALILVLVFKR